MKIKRKQNKILQKIKILLDQVGDILFFIFTILTTLSYLLDGCPKNRAEQVFIGLIAFVLSIKLFVTYIQTEKLDWLTLRFLLGLISVIVITAALFINKTSVEKTIYDLFDKSLGVLMLLFLILGSFLFCLSLVQNIKIPRILRIAYERLVQNISQKIKLFFS
jgi:di/tricarboxylate transporter